MIELGSAPLLLVLAYAAIIVVLVTAHVMHGAWDKFINRAARVQEAFGDHVAPLATVTLVHGTWAGAGEWTLANSAVCTNLQDLFQSKIGFFRFVWSGNNSIASRADAAARLTAALGNLFAKYPQAQHFVVAHSHGGNVALNALTPALVSRMAGLVCLATPVLLTRHRSYPKYARRPVRLVPGFLALAGASTYLLKSEARTKLEIALVLLAVFSFGWAMCELIRRAQKKSERATILQDLDFVPRQKVIFVRATGDEAASILSAAQSFSWLLTKLTFAPFGLIAAAEQKIDSLRGYLKRNWALPSAACCCAVAGLLLQPEEPILWALIAVPIVVLAPFLGQSVGILFGGAAAIVMLVPAFLILPLVGAVVGSEMAASAFATEIFIEPAPPGNWTLMQLSHRKHNEGLRHSVIYDEEMCLKAWCGWIVDRYNAESPVKLPLKPPLPLNEVIANLKSSVAALFKKRGQA